MKGREERSRLLTNCFMEMLPVHSSWEAIALRNSEAKQGSLSFFNILFFFASLSLPHPQWLPRMNGNEFLSKQRLESPHQFPGDTVAPLAVDFSG
jgi:hypothetical protein